MKPQLTPFTSSEQNKAAVQRWIEEGFNQQNLEAFDLFFSADMVNHELPPSLPPGLAGTKMLASMFTAAFPDIRVTIENIFAEGAKVACLWSATGVHQGELMGMPPTGRAIAIKGMTIDRFENGKSVEHWEIFDQLGMLQQIGAVPVPG